MSFKGGKWVRLSSVPFDTGIYYRAHRNARLGGKDTIVLAERLTKTSTLAACVRSLQLRVFGFSFFQDGDVGVGVFPEGEEIFVGGEGTGASSIGVCAL